MKNIYSLLLILCLFAGTLSVNAATPAKKPVPPLPVAPKTFEERLFLDWLAKDSDGREKICFLDKNNNTVEFKLLSKALLAFEQKDREPFEKEMKSLLDATIPGADPKWRNLYSKICQARRQNRLAIVSDFAPVWIYTKHYVIGASHYAYTEDVTDEQYKDFSSDRRDGGQLCKMEIAPDGSIRHEVLYATAKGTIRDPDVSWDGTKIVFAMRRDFNTDDFHLYEYNVLTKKVRQLTFGLGFADIEPVYLPNDDIMFGSTRCVQITDCWWTEVSNFYVIDPNGRNMRRVSFDQVTVNYPKVLNDGRVIYTRWDYNDRGQIYPQPLFVMNSDATGQTEYYGNNSWFPTTIMHGRPIPDSNKVIAIASGHHSYQHGKLLLIDRSKGNQENQGCTLVAPVRETPAVRVDAYGQGGELFQYPYALDESNFLVTYLPEGFQRHRTYPIPFAIYYMDLNGNRELLAYDPAISCNQQVPLVPREKPAVRASQVDPKKSTGEYYVHNVYEGPGLKGVPKGTIKSLRVVALGFRRAGIRKNSNGGPAGGAMSATPVSIHNGAWDTKHVLGNVPVEEDGSAYFRVPAQTPLYFQMLDANGDTVQTMRSWSTLQPGEFFACVGCHEPKENTITNFGKLSSKALRKPPVDLQRGPFPKGIFQDGFSFVREIQPILDEHCIQCHTGGKKADGTKAPFSLFGDQYIPEKPDSNGKFPNGKRPFETAGRKFSEAYVNLTDYGNHVNRYIHWLGIQEGPQLLPPYFAGAALSPMIKMLRAGTDANHKNLHLTQNELKKIATWIDLLIPYCADYREAADWTPQEHAIYAYYEMKKNEMDRIIERNCQKMAKGKLEKRVPDLGELEQFKAGGPAAKEKFIADFLKRPVPNTNQKSGTENVRRNLALNINDTQGEKTCYPHAVADSELRYLDINAAKNAIDGKKQSDSKNSKEPIPAWRPDLRRDLSLSVELGHTVETDQVVLSIEADPQLGPTWTKGVLKFSDGSSEKINLTPAKDPQSFKFAKRNTSFVQLTGLEYNSIASGSNDKKKTVFRPAVVEFEIWGKSVEPK